MFDLTTWVWIYLAIHVGSCLSWWVVCWSAQPWPLREVKPRSSNPQRYSNSDFGKDFADLLVRILERDYERAHSEVLVVAAFLGVFGPWVWLGVVWGLIKRGQYVKGG